MQGSSANDIVGFGQAVEEAGLNGKIAVVGTSLASMAGKLLETDAIQMASAWDPALAGKAMNKLALMIKNGETPADGMDLGIKGYEKLILKGKVFYGAAWIDITKDNLKDYPF
jgi:simple sugar transport system substrate-binding protein